MPTKRREGSFVSGFCSNHPTLSIESFGLTRSSFVHFWAAAQSQVYKEKPDSMESLIQCVQTFAEGYTHETIKNVCKNVLKRASLCLELGGGHFQHLL